MLSKKKICFNEELIYSFETFGWRYASAECDKPGAVCEDPRFIGGDGVTFYFHGQKERDFCLVSDTNLHINGHFIGKRGDGMKRDFTWVQSIGVLFDDHKLFVGAKKVSLPASLVV